MVTVEAGPNHAGVGEKNQHDTILGKKDMGPHGTRRISSRLIEARTRMSPRVHSRREDLKTQRFPLDVQPSYAAMETVEQRSDSETVSQQNDFEPVREGMSSETAKPIPSIKKNIASEAWAETIETRSDSTRDNALSVALTRQSKASSQHSPRSLTRRKDIKRRLFSDANVAHQQNLLESNANSCNSVKSAESNQTVGILNQEEKNVEVTDASPRIPSHKYSIKKADSSGSGGVTTDTSAESNEGSSSSSSKTQQQNEQFFSSTSPRLISRRIDVHRRVFPPGRPNSHAAIVGQSQVNLDTQIGAADAILPKNIQVSEEKRKPPESNSEKKELSSTPSETLSQRMLVRRRELQRRALPLPKNTAAAVSPSTKPLLEGKEEKSASFFKPGESLDITKILPQPDVGEQSATKLSPRSTNLRAATVLKSDHKGGVAPQSDTSRYPNISRIQNICQFPSAAVEGAFDVEKSKLRQIPIRLQTSLMLPNDEPRQKATAEGSKAAFVELSWPPEHLEAPFSGAGSTSSSFGEGTKLLPSYSDGLSRSRSPTSQDSRLSRLRSMRSRAPTVLGSNPELRRNLDAASVVMPEEKSINGSSTSSRSSRSSLSTEELGNVAKRALSLSKVRAETRSTRLRNSPLHLILMEKKMKKPAGDGFTEGKEKMPKDAPAGNGDEGTNLAPASPKVKTLLSNRISRAEKFAALQDGSQTYESWLSSPKPPTLSEKAGSRTLLSQPNNGASDASPSQEHQSSDKKPPSRVALLVALHRSRMIARQVASHHNNGVSDDPVCQQRQEGETAVNVVPEKSMNGLNERHVLQGNKFGHLKSKQTAEDSFAALKNDWNVKMDNKSNQGVQQNQQPALRSSPPPPPPPPPMYLSPSTLPTLAYWTNTAPARMHAGVHNRDPVGIKAEAYSPHSISLSASGSSGQSELLGSSTEECDMDQVSAGTEQDCDDPTYCESRSQGEAATTIEVSLPTPPPPPPPPPRPSVQRRILAVLEKRKPSEGEESKLMEEQLRINDTQTASDDEKDARALSDLSLPPEDIRHIVLDKDQSAPEMKLSEIIQSAVSEVETSVLLGETIMRSTDESPMNAWIERSPLPAIATTPSSHQRKSTTPRNPSPYSNQKKEVASSSPNQPNVKQTRKGESPGTGRPRLDLTLESPTYRKPMSAYVDSEQKTVSELSSSGSQSPKPDALRWWQTKYGGKVAGATNIVVHKALARFSPSNKKKSKERRFFGNDKEEEPVAVSQAHLNDLTSHERVKRQDVEEDDIFSGLEEEADSRQVEAAERVLLRNALRSTDKLNRPARTTATYDRQRVLGAGEAGPKEKERILAEEPPPSARSEADHSRRSGMVLDSSNAVKSVTSELSSSLVGRPRHGSRYRPNPVATIEEGSAEDDPLQIAKGQSATIADVNRRESSADGASVDDSDESLALSMEDSVGGGQEAGNSAFVAIGAAIVESISSVCRVPENFPHSPGECAKKTNKACNHEVDANEDDYSASIHDDKTKASFVLNNNATFFTEHGISTISNSFVTMNDDERRVWLAWENRDKAQEEHQQQQKEEEAKNTSDSSVSRHQKKEELQAVRHGAQRRLLEHASTAMKLYGFSNVDEKGKPVPIIYNNADSFEDMGGSLLTTGGFSLKSLGFITSEDRTQLERFSSTLKNDGIEVLKLGRRKQWQIRYLTVSKETTVSQGANFVHEANQCPKALFWLKRFRPHYPYRLDHLKRDGRGGLLFSNLTKVEPVAFCEYYDRIPKRQKAAFPIFAGVCLEYTFESEERCRQLMICFKTTQEAQFFCAAVAIIKQVVERQEAYARDIAVAIVEQAVDPAKDESDDIPQLAFEDFPLEIGEEDEDDDDLTGPIQERITMAV